MRKSYEPGYLYCIAKLLKFTQLLLFLPLPCLADVDLITSLKTPLIWPSSSANVDHFQVTDDTLVLLQTLTTSCL
jgi:hypothetical protein